MSLAIRLALWSGGAAFTLLLVTSVILYLVLVTNFDREDDQHLVQIAAIIETVIRDRPNDEAELREEIDRESEARPGWAVFIRVLAGDGSPVLETTGMEKSLPSSAFPAPVVFRSENSEGVDLEGRDGRPFRALSAKAGATDGKGHVIQVALDRANEERLVSSYRKWLFLVLASGLLVAGAASYLIARRGLRPLSDMGETVSRIHPSTLHERISDSNLPRELISLAEKFNGMLFRLEEGFTRLSDLSTDIAHELRTPIANMRGEAEVILSKPRPAEEYRTAIESSLEECERLSGLIDKLLFLGRAENPHTQIERTALSLPDELSAIRRFYATLAATHGVAIEVAVAPDLTAELDRTLFQRAIGNLVENALSHTPRGGSITLRASQGPAGCAVQVSDTGAGIPHEHLPFVFDRFHRVDPSRSRGTGSNGLGLSIVKGIASMHQGSVRIESTVGQGTTVTIVFPNQPDKPARFVSPAGQS